MPQQTFYWYDFETFGLDPRRDRPAQFAGIRTDREFNVIGEPLVLYCKPAGDVLPDPESCLITGITPQTAHSKGVCEAEFIGRINNEFSRPNTCVTGYNNIRFDDEVTRNTLYRNFHDPYAREWQSGNSRWDLIDTVRLTCALRPGDISWPTGQDGAPCFRLDQLTKNNGIEHERCHDALADVVATIAVAKLIKIRQPKLYDYVFRNRGKFQATRFLDVANKSPVLHVSGKYPAQKHCIAVVAPIAKHPLNDNATIVYDLSDNPDSWIGLDPEQIRERVFTPRDELPRGVERISLKAVHANRCPVLVPINALRKEDAKRLDIDIVKCRENMRQIINNPGLPGKIQDVFSGQPDSDATDPDEMLYSGGFFSDHDKSIMETVRLKTPEQLRGTRLDFQDSRLPEMLFRYRARNFPESLTEDEVRKWRRFRIKRLSDPKAGGSIILDEYNARLNEIHRSASSREELAIVAALKEYGDKLWDGLNGIQC